MLMQERTVLQQKELLQMLLEQNDFQKLPGLLTLCLGCLALDEWTKMFAEANYYKQVE